MERHNNALIISGKEVAAKIRDELKAEATAIERDTGRPPGLAVVLVGENPASKVYVRNKAKACEEVGIRSFQHILPASVSQEELLSLVSKLNVSQEVHGILVQLPLPGHIDDELILEAVSPAKDVDGFHPYNMGRLAIGSPLLSPCTPLGVMKLLDSIGYDASGKDAVIVGRSNIVGKPVAFMLLKRNATVSICHSKTTDLPAKVKAADVVIAAVGREHYIKGEWIKDGAVVIDVGINRTKDGTLAGDVDFEGASKHASYITPVPGGVGPMTVAMLLSNTVDAARRQMKK